MLAGGLVVSVLLAALWDLPEAVVNAATVVAGHGTLLIAALGWSASDRGDANAMNRGALVPLAVILGAALASSLHDLGSLAYLAVPVWVGYATARGRLRGLGLGRPVSRSAIAAGFVVGAALGAHVLIAASMTLGHQPRLMDVAVLRGVAYDLGPHVIGTEAFFRGALFNRAQRRWSFGVAALISTTACVGRYLIDPRLPGSAEVLSGMVFYMTLLSVANCWLFWRFGSLAPGLVSALTFFTAYRTISE